MKSVTLLCASVALLGASQAHSWGGPVMDTYGQRITTVTGECYYYGDVGPDVCTPKKEAMPVMAEPEPVVVAPAPVVAPEPAYVAPTTAPVYVAPAPVYVPPVVVAEPVVKEVINLDGVSFRSGSDELTFSSNKKLDEAAQTLLDNPSVKVVVAGHTDSSGDTLRNLELSEKRAAQVRSYLVSKGVNPDKLVARGYGDTEAIASNANAAGRAQNRRVELRILE